MESGNIIDLKTKAFAVRIIKFAQFLQEQKENLFSQNKFYDQEQVLELTLENEKTQLVKQILSINLRLL